jgi:hypothetical protein
MFERLYEEHKIIEVPSGDRAAPAAPAWVWMHQIAHLDFMSNFFIHFLPKNTG